MHVAMEIVQEMYIHLGFVSQWVTKSPNDIIPWQPTYWQHKIPLKWNELRWQRIMIRTPIKIIPFVVKMTVECCCCCHGAIHLTLFWPLKM
jgi:hypothetical protein